MKKFTYLLIIFTIFMVKDLFPNDTPSIEQVFDRYKDIDGFDYVVINPEMFSLFGNLAVSAKDSNNKEVDSNDIGSMIKSINGIKILTCNVPDSDDNQNSDKKKASKKKEIAKEDSNRQRLSVLKNNFYKELNMIVSNSANKFVELMTVKNDDTRVKILIKKDDKEQSIVTEFILISNETDEISAIWISGRINLSDLTKLTKQVKHLNFNLEENMQFKGPNDSSDE